MSLSEQDVLGRQGSQEYDCAQLMRDLCDSVERETDIKEQLKFIEEESRMLRKKLAEMEDENEALRVQLKKLSLKASRWKEESEGRHAQGKTPSGALCVFLSVCLRVCLSVCLFCLRVCLSVCLSVCP